MTSHASPKLRRIVTEALFRRRGLFVGTILVGLGLAGVLIALVPKLYQSEARLLVQHVQTQNPAAAEVTAAEVSSEEDLLVSQGVARRTLGAGASDAQVGALEMRLKVETEPQANRIHVTMEGPTPWVASADLRKVLKAYFDERAARAVPTGAAAFFGPQADAKAQQLAVEQQKLTDFDVLHGIADSDLDEQKKLLVQQIAVFENQLSQARISLAEQRSKTASAKHELSLTPAHSRAAEHVAANSGSQERLGTELVALVNRRAELLKQHPATDPQVMAVSDKIAATQKAMATAAPTSAAETSDVNPVYQQLSAAVAATTAEFSRMVVQTTALQKQLKEAQDRLAELEQSTATYEELKRNVTQANAEYTLYAQRREEAQGGEATVKAKLFDVSVLQAPVASTTPVRPRSVVYLATAFAGSVVLAILLAWLAEALSGKVYSPSQLEALTGERTLATFAEEDSAENAEANRREYRQLLLEIRDEPREADTGCCVAFTSAMSGEGVSYLVRHLATEAVRQRSSRVAVMDLEALLRKFEATGDAGFGMALDEPVEHWVLDLSEEPVEGMAICGNDAQRLFATRLAPILMEMRREFDFIFLDCPSLYSSMLAREMDRCVEGYVGVVAAGRRKESLDAMLTMSQRTRAPWLGYVLNRRRNPVPRWMS